jgi:putative toxin-antitoxin system antitoxin component (TIGR02293 family)
MEKKKTAKQSDNSFVKEAPMAYAAPAARMPLVYRHMIEDDHHLIQSANKGVSAKAIGDFSRLSGKTKEEIGDWIYFTPKTIRNYEAQEKKLPVLQSELLLKLYLLYDKGMGVFGSVSAFNDWLEKPAFGLHGQTPESLLTTSTGMNLVQDELIRIEYGDFA